jgi:hypothetical protein
MASTEDSYVRDRRYGHDQFRRAVGYGNVTERNQNARKFSVGTKKTFLPAFKKSFFPQTSLRNIAAGAVVSTREATAFTQLIHMPSEIPEIMKLRRNQLSSTR